jgi:hypothetical protein
MRPYRIETIVGLALVALAAGPPARGQNAIIPSVNTAPGIGTSMWNSGYLRFNTGATGRNSGFLAFTTTPAASYAAGFNGATTEAAVPVRGLFQDVAPTDPLIRQIQIGPPPVGAIAEVDASRGIAVVNVPGAGSRLVRTVGPVVQTAAGPAVRAVDAATGVEFLALTPAPEAVVSNPGPLVAAKVVKVTDGAVILEREEDGVTVTEILPSDRVYAAVRGGFVPAASVRRLRPGLEVFIPATGGPRGKIIVRRANGFGTRASSASGAPENAGR